MELREVDARFERAFVTFVTEWDDDPDTAREGLPYYLYYAEIARIIANDIRTGNRVRLAPIMDLVEKLHIEGDEAAREGATIGLLEGIQASMLQSNTGLHIANMYLGRESAREWKKLIHFWDHKQSDAPREG
ncbi:hypothetical protein VCJ71_01640 [Alteriqipengyuania sp. WL0013]|uniref:DUF7674 family protein n=1 Tax=Alteriqipengyuania sp. WL0013 TaxID=3110773 RepID=UPI002CBF8890|nr:hypothetical protein [Alteriqipengyuania sp. WL0013]MEB3414760.1 hypothetical protein [Alteriqipengyuania sp. WL0013]